MEGLPSLSREDAATLRANEELLQKVLCGYRKQVSSIFMGLFDSLSARLNAADDYAALYCDMYGHVDACYRDLIRDKLANCFKTSLRPDILGKNLSSEQKESLKTDGLLGGQEHVRSALTEATKRDDLLKKSLVPPRNVKNKKGRTTSYQGTSSGQSTSKFSSRTQRSPERYRPRKGFYDNRRDRRSGKSARDGDKDNDD